MSDRPRHYSAPSTQNHQSPWNNNRRGGKRRRRPTENNGDQPRQDYSCQNNQQPRPELNARGGRQRGRRNRGSRAQQNDESSLRQADTSQGVVELPGLYWDPEKKKYFAIASDQSGISGYSQSDVVAKQRQQKLICDVEEHREMSRRRPGVRNITSLQTIMQRGGRGVNAELMERRFAESRLTSIKHSPHSVHQVMSNFSIDGCSFLSAAKDGTSLFGCWRTSHVSFGTFFNVSIDEQLRQQCLRLKERDDAGLHNTMGLHFEQNRYGMQIREQEIVDMCVAPMDTEVTGCLYVTASTRFMQDQLRSICKVSLRPLSEWCTPENVDTLNCPIYNHNWSSRDHIWSCGWSTEKMWISLGMEESIRVRDLVSSSTFKISTKGKCILYQKFSADGKIIIMCPHGGDIMCKDVNSKHCIDDRGDWPNTKSCCFVQSFKNQHHNNVLTQDFDGHLLLWDLRMKRKAVLEYEGHCNNGYKLPCIVDDDERFIFSVGSDGCTRGWSISSGDLLCELPSPHPLTRNCPFPRIAYSDTWGGVLGNTALVVATNSSINVHQLGF